jgi:ABC-2 type transport system ATP-binding protein
MDNVGKTADAAGLDKSAEASENTAGKVFDEVRADSLFGTRNRGTGPVLAVSGVTKVYKTKNGGRFIAVDNVSFTVSAGEVVGFIGPNGAGKSTTIKIITGLADATAGSVSVCGCDVKKERVAALSRVGCIVENPDMYLNWTAEENLEYLMSLEKPETLGKAEKMPQKEFFRLRSEKLLKTVGLYDRRKDVVRKYSLGMRQRLGIAQALLNNPSLLVLDEPTNGLDPAGIKEVRDILHKLAADYGMAILVSSHLLSEVQVMCDHYVIINRGKLIGSYSREDLEKFNTGNKVVLTTDDVVKAKDALKDTLGLDAEIIGGGKVTFSTDKAVSDVTKELILAGVNVLGIAREETSLEDFFMKLTEGGKNA